MVNNEIKGRINNNIVYVFVPFRFDDIDGVMSAARKRCVGGDAVWEDGSKEVRSYFFTSLTDKISMSGNGACCVHLAAKEESLGWAGRRDPEDWKNALVAQRMEFGFSMSDVFHLYRPDYLHDAYGDVDFCFHIDSAKLSVFGTGIGVVSLGLVFDISNPENLALSEYLLKIAVEEQDRVTGKRRNCSIVQQTGVAERTDFTTLAKRVIRSSIGLVDVDFKFYSQRPRANLLSLFLVEEKLDQSGFDRELYYLGNGYGVGYIYPGKDHSADCQCFGEPNIRWCISNEIACCLVRPDLHKPSSGFIYDSFYHKFRREYLFMFVWLLHQKYAFYAFLTDISAKGLSVAGRENDTTKTEALYDYKRKFTDFEANYVFARVTEVPQYQRLYDAVSRQFALRTMYDDVKRPLVALEDLVRQDESRIKEKEQKITDGITKILAIMGLLSVASALVDSYDFVGKFLGGENARFGFGVRICQYVCVAAIIIAVCWSVTHIFRCLHEGGVPNRDFKKGSRCQ